MVSPTSQRDNINIFPHPGWHSCFSFHFIWIGFLFYTLSPLCQAPSWVPYHLPLPPPLSPGAPVVASFPHFYLGDPKYANAFVGLNPVKEFHQTFLDLNPVRHLGFVSCFCQTDAVSSSVIYRATHPCTRGVWWRPLVFYNQAPPSVP